MYIECVKSMSWHGHEILNLLVFVAVSVVLLTADVAHADTSITTNISSSTTWTTAGGVYIIENSVAVNSGVILTIDPGVIVKFQSAKSLTINGTLNAAGSTSSPVYFTSIKDDIGGDTNGDGTSTSPAAGNWVNMKLSSGGSASLENVVVRYGGDGFWNAGGTGTISSSEIASSSASGIYQTAGTTTALESDIHNVVTGSYVTGGNLTVSTSTIRNCSSYGVQSYTTGTISLNGNTFSDNSNAAAYVGLSGGVVIKQTGNTASNNYTNGIVFTGAVDHSQSWPGDTMPYVISGTVSVSSGKTLTIDPGAVVKFDGTTAMVDVNGILKALGASTSKIYFTSLKDDTVGGDTNNDGGSTSPAANDWKRIETSAGASTTLQYVMVSYGGYNNNDSVNNLGGTLNVYSSEIATTTSIGIYQTAGTSTITGTTIRDSWGGGSSGIFTTGGFMKVVGCDISGMYAGIWAYGARMSVDACDFHDNENGVLVNYAPSGVVVVKSSDIHDNDYGVYVGSSGAVPTLGSNSFHDNTYYGVYKASGTTVPAEYNYWGSSSGPTTGSPSAPQDRVSANVDYEPWSTQEHYTLGYSSVNSTTSEMRYVETTDYDTALDAGIASWNSLGKVYVAEDTASTTADLGITDAYEPSESWVGLYCPNATCDGFGTGFIWFNTYYFSGLSADEKQMTATHELGHALGLDHSYSNNIMVDSLTAQTDLGWQDISDYLFLYP